MSGVQGVQATLQQLGKGRVHLWQLDAAGRKGNQEVLEFTVTLMLGLAENLMVHGPVAGHVLLEGLGVEFTPGLSVPRLSLLPRARGSAHESPVAAPESVLPRGPELSTVEQEWADVWALGVLWVQCLGGTRSADYEVAGQFVAAQLAPGPEAVKDKCPQRHQHFAGQYFRRQVLLRPWGRRVPHPRELWMASRMMATHPEDRPTLAMVRRWFLAAAVDISEGRFESLSVRAGPGEGDGARDRQQAQAALAAGSAAGAAFTWGARPEADTVHCWVCVPPGWLQPHMNRDGLATQVLAALWGLHGNSQPPVGAKGVARSPLSASSTLAGVVAQMVEANQRLVVRVNDGMQACWPGVAQAWEDLRTVDCHGGVMMTLAPLEPAPAPHASDARPGTRAVAATMHLCDHLIGVFLGFHTHWVKRCLQHDEGRSYVPEVSSLPCRDAAGRKNLVEWLAIAAALDTLQPLTMDAWVAWAVLDGLNSLVLTGQGFAQLGGGKVCVPSVAESVHYLCTRLVPNELVRQAAQGLFLGLLAHTPEWSNFNHPLYCTLASLLALCEADRSLVKEGAAAHAALQAVGWPPRADTPVAALCVAMETMAALGRRNVLGATGASELVLLLLQDHPHGRDPWWTAKVALQGVLDRPGADTAVAAANGIAAWTPAPLLARVKHVQALTVREAYAPPTVSERCCLQALVWDAHARGQQDGQPPGFTGGAGAGGGGGAGKKGRRTGRNRHRRNVRVTMLSPGTGEVPVTLSDSRADELLSTATAAAGAVYQHMLEAVDVAARWHGRRDPYMATLLTGVGSAHAEALLMGVPRVRDARAFAAAMTVALDACMVELHMGAAAAYVLHEVAPVGAPCRVPKCAECRRKPTRTDLNRDVLIHELVTGESDAVEELSGLGRQWACGRLARMEVDTYTVAVDNYALACLQVAQVSPFWDMARRVRLAQQAVEMYEHSLTTKQRWSQWVGSVSVAAGRYNLAQAYKLRGNTTMAAMVMMGGLQDHAVTEWPMMLQLAVAEAETCIQAETVPVGVALRVCARVLLFPGAVVRHMRTERSLFGGGGPLHYLTASKLTLQASLKVMHRVTASMNQLLVPGRWTARLVDLRLQWLRVEMRWAIGLLDDVLGLVPLAEAEAGPRSAYIMYTVRTLLGLFWKPCVSRQARPDLGYALCFLVHWVFRSAVPVSAAMQTQCPGLFEDMIQVGVCRAVSCRAVPLLSWSASCSVGCAVQSWYRKLQQEDHDQEKPGTPRPPTVWQFYAAVRDVVLAQGDCVLGGKGTGLAVLRDVLGAHACK